MTLFSPILALLLSLGGLQDAIDTRIGTDASDSPTASIFGAGGEVLGNTIPCVSEPFGMTFWTPQTGITQKKGISPYYYSAPEFLGFRASHWMSGSATQDYGSFYIIPGGTPCTLDHSSEQASPSYYRLGSYEMTGKSHSAIFRLVCDKIIIGVNNDCGEGFVSYDEDSHVVTGGNPVRRIYQGWGQSAGFSGWIFAEFDRKVVSCRKLDDSRLEIKFEKGDGPVLVKMGCSFKSIEGARNNLASEIPSWDFDSVRSDVEKTWNSRLGKIEIQGGREQDREHFYCSLWHASLLPRTVSDCGEPLDFDDFSLWDTFRALHPLLTILDPTLSGEMMQALVRKYEKGGWLPIFPAWGSYTSAMIGDHAVSVITDAYVKGIRNFDYRTAYKAMRKNAFETPCDSLYIDGRGRRALGTYIRYGYLPLEEPVKDAFHKGEQASRTLEYAYDDWCVSRMALRSGHIRDFFKLSRRAGNWKNVLDPVTGYPQGRHADGSLLSEDNSLKKPPPIPEGTPCHSVWFVPHDVKGLVRHLGRAEFEARLDSMFTLRRYWHGNEPCHQVAYLYDYIGKPEKTRTVVKEILLSEYRNTPGGLSGNDDTGQMSAWYVFSSMGFYPVCPGSGEYALGVPAFESVTIHLENGRDFTISRSSDARGPRRPFLKHRRILRGGRLVLPSE
ncbi:MAG: GH92 family glycosyl hydrolase [Bacteroidales bacterium]|nr:GH92 family glycosyl hydrolase [Bacteroidales bacterium]